MISLNFSRFVNFTLLFVLLFIVACAKNKQPSTSCRGVDKCSLDKKCLAKECEQKNAFSCKLLADEYWYDGEPMDCSRQTDTKQARLYYQNPAICANGTNAMALSVSLVSFLSVNKP